MAQLEIGTVESFLNVCILCRTYLILDVATYYLFAIGWDLSKEILNTYLGTYKKKKKNIPYNLE